jgi:hypothetical protein
MPRKRAIRTYCLRWVWPDEIKGFGVRHMGELGRCLMCDDVTVSVYGDTHVCLSHALWLTDDTEYPADCPF